MTALRFQTGGGTSDIPGLPSGAEAETTRMGNIETTKARVFLPAVAVAAMNCGRTEFCYSPPSNKNILCHGHLILAVNAAMPLPHQVYGITR